MYIFITLLHFKGIGKNVFVGGNVGKFILWTEANISDLSEFTDRCRDNIKLELQNPSEVYKSSNYAPLGFRCL